MTTGLSFNRGKNHFTNHRYTVQKASISIIGSTPKNAQNIVPTLALNKLGKI